MNADEGMKSALQYFYESATSVAGTMDDVFRDFWRKTANKHSGAIAAAMLVGEDICQWLHISHSPAHHVERRSKDSAC